MKVYIGPYVNRWMSEFHDHYMERKYGKEYWSTKFDDDRKNTFDELLTQKIERVLQWIYNKTINLYLDHKERVVRVRLDYYDTWSADHTLSLIILPLLKELKEKKQGSPYVYDEDVPEHLRRAASSEKKEPENYTDSNFHARWDWIIDEMIWAFEQTSKADRDSQFYSGEMDIYFEKDETGMSRMMTGPNHTFTVDREAQKQYEDRIQKGLILFGKYYHCLWN